jgi:hypothetical protein
MGCPTSTNQDIHLLLGLPPGGDTMRVVGSAIDGGVIIEDIDAQAVVHGRGDQVNGGRGNITVIVDMAFGRAIRLRRGWRSGRLLVAVFPGINRTLGSHGTFYSGDGNLQEEQESRKGFWQSIDLEDGNFIVFGV